MKNYSPKQWMLRHARELRYNLTPAERLVWNILRSRQFYGLKFVRQFIIGPFIFDFCCRAKKIVIETDGGTHAEQRAYDQTRTNFIKSSGYRIIRFMNNHITDDPNEFVIALERILKLESIEFVDV